MLVVAVLPLAPAALFLLVVLEHAFLASSPLFAPQTFLLLFVKHFFFSLGVVFKNLSYLMSVVSLSPSDIVYGVVLAARAIQALKVVNGSQGQFQQANQNVALGIDALKALDDLATSLGTSSSSNRIRDVVKEVLDEEVKWKGKLAWYDQRLGPQAPVGKRHGIPAKLKLAFSGAKEQEERSNRSVRGIDAAIIALIL